MEGGDSRGFLATRRDNERIFRAAISHSRFVRMLRVAIPTIVAIGGVAAYGAYSWFDPLSALARLPVSTDGLVVSGTKITMQQPRLVGFTKDARPYSVTARTAAQDITKPDAVELQDIRATIASRDQGDIEVTARDGVYDGKTEKLTLRNNIVLSSPAYRARLKQAVVGVRTGHVLSEQPVEVRMLQGTINANRLEVIDSGAIVRFDRGVDLLLQGDRSRLDPTAGKP
jgi:lipopolysaccharide export system protein LptC